MQAKSVDSYVPIRPRDQNTFGERKKRSQEQFDRAVCAHNRIMCGVQTKLEHALPFSSDIACSPFCFMGSLACWVRSLVVSYQIWYWNDIRFNAGQGERTREQMGEEEMKTGQKKKKTFKIQGGL